MKRPSSLPVLFQVAALATLAVVMSQAVAFGVVVLSPEPRPAGFSIEAAADALKGEPAETSDGRALKRRITDQPVSQGGADRIDPMALAIAAGLADRLGVEPDRVRVAIEHGSMRRPGRPPEGEPGRANFVIMRPGAEGTSLALPAPKTTEPGSEQVTAQIQMRQSAPRGDDGAIEINSTTRQFTILTHRLTFAPFSASVRQPDGRWATVEPPRGLLSPWQTRMLLALAMSMLLLAPLVWWLARRLTRPIRVFAEAAERLGADPDAAPLAPSGPSEVRTAIHAFNDMQASLRSHMRQRTQTIAAIAHDLRTPLTRLRFRAEQAPAAVRDRMAADIEEMDALIAQAMAFVRGESTPDRREPLDLGPLAADCAAGFAETGADVSFDGDGVLPVEADPAALRRALANLIGNAVKYGGGARVTAFAEAGRAVIEVV
ncbi:MAG: HAMP domain-containing protein, partial [Alphaproteobacteria bacterium]|nr:HAMP domain-containing protein [Alphaproteobacteria bacterium]